MTTPDWALALHGGAGRLPRGALSAAQDAAYAGALARAADLGRVMLEGGAAALDTVEAVVRALEDDPLFNAGTGAAYSLQGRQELDAALMEGRSRKAGAVAGLRGFRNPVRVARMVLERDDLVLLTGSGAAGFAARHKAERRPRDGGHTAARWRALAEVHGRLGLRPQTPPFDLASVEAGELVHDEGGPGTVGAVARDLEGNLAAATSTGGLTGKQWGRVGDTPVIGAGTWAENGAAAVSCTGAGEYFIRLGMARSLAARVRLLNESVEAAAQALVLGELEDLQGHGGLIAVGATGPAVWCFNTPGMHRARVSAGRPAEIGIYGPPSGARRVTVDRDRTRSPRVLADPRMAALGV